jgi:hypothetical protein
MRLILRLLIVLLGATIAQAASARSVIISPEFFTPTRISPPKVMASGARIRIWQAWALNPDCSKSGSVKFHILEAPAHGVLSINSGPVFPDGSCTGRVRGQRIFYTSRAGYKGKDIVVFETFSPVGRSFIVRIPIVIL